MAIGFENPKVIVADVRIGLRQLKPNSVQCIVTSPPYYGLRSYGTEPAIWDGRSDCVHDWQELKYTFSRQKVTSHLCSICKAWKGELGAEPSPDMYVKHLADIFDQCKDVLRPDGLFWLNIGDTFALKPYEELFIKAGDLIGIPHLVAFELRKRGWLWPSAPVWYKTNPQPESTDARPGKSYEYCLMFAKNGSGKPLFWTHFLDGKGTRTEPVQEYVWVDRAETYKIHKEPPAYDGWEEEELQGEPRWFRKPCWEPHKYFYDAIPVRKPNPNPALAAEGFSHNLKDVWTLSTVPSEYKHFAKFPERLVLDPILSSTSPQACPKCGAPFARHSWLESVYNDNKRVWGIYRNISGQPDLRLKGVKAHTRGFYPTCDCEGNDGSARCTVVDTFSGTGTLLLVARYCGQNAIGYEIKQEFADEALRKLNQLALI